MAVLKYRDPADGTYKPVSYGGGSGAQTPVGMNDLTDADTVASAPAVGDSLVWDGTAWVPSGPAVIIPPTPTLLTHASRWIDAIPRFATVAARDAQYAITGASNGMKCWVETPYGQEFTFMGGAWRLTGGNVPSLKYTCPGYMVTNLAWTPLIIPGGVAQWNIAGCAITNGSAFQVPVAGRYSIVGNIAVDHSTTNLASPFQMWTAFGTYVAKNEDTVSATDSPSSWTRMPVMGEYNLQPAIDYYLWVQCGGGLIYITCSVQYVGAA